jgi:hypothetical protein
MDKFLNRTLGATARLFIEHAREVAKPLAKKKSFCYVCKWPIAILPQEFLSILRKRTNPNRRE